MGRLTCKNKSQKIYRFLIFFYYKIVSAGEFSMRVDAWWEKLFKRWLHWPFCGEQKFIQRKFLLNKNKIKKPLISLNCTTPPNKCTSRNSLYGHMYVMRLFFATCSLYASFMAEWKRFISMTLSQQQQHRTHPIWKSCENLIKIKFHKILQIFHHHWHSPNTVWCVWCALQRSKGTNIMITMSLQNNLEQKLAFNLYILHLECCQRWHT